MRFPRLRRVFVAVLFFVLPVVGQSPNGTINGIVVDPSSRVIATAEIIAVNDVTGVKYTTKTNDEGIYVLPNLPPGPYRLQVSKVGFKTLIKPDIVLNIQDALSINFTLPIGAVFEVMTVEGGAPLVNTESAAVSTIIDRKYVENMPLNGRSFQDLILLTPGVVSNTPQAGAAAGFSGEFSVNGQRTEGNYYTVDGVSANLGISPGLPDSAGTTGSLPATNGRAPRIRRSRTPDKPTRREAPTTKPRHISCESTAAQQDHPEAGPRGVAARRRPAAVERDLPAATHRPATARTSPAPDAAHRGQIGS